jgi:Ca2+-binding RTX toxin-like protein
VSGFENLEGSDYNDVLAGNNAKNIIDGLGGIDLVSYAEAAEGVIVDLAAETAKAGAVTDTIRSCEGIIGSTFNDTLIGDLGRNYLHGGSGNDTVSYANVKPSEGGVVVSLAIASYQDTLASGLDRLVGIENLTGSANDDHLSGNTASNIIGGDKGADTIAGGGGADILTGDNDADRFNDRFVYSALADSRDTARDIIKDFRQGEDSLDVAAIDAKSSTPANDAFTFLGVALAFTGEGQIRLEQSGVDTVVYFNTNANPASEMTVVLENVLAITLSATDFIL